VDFGRTVSKARVRSTGAQSTTGAPSGQGGITNIPAAQPHHPQELEAILGDAALLPLQLMDVLQPWAGLLAAEPAAHLHAFLAAEEAEGGGEPSLEEIGAEVERLRSEADAVMELCGDDVRTGGLPAATPHWSQQLAPCMYCQPAEQALLPASGMPAAGGQLLMQPAQTAMAAPRCRPVPGALPPHQGGPGRRRPAAGARAAGARAPGAQAVQRGDRRGLRGAGCRGELAGSQARRQPGSTAGWWFVSSIAGQQALIAAALLQRSWPGPAPRAPRCWRSRR
jgi:hypothetical protein